MNIKIKFGDIKITYENILEKDGMGNLYKTMFSKSNLDLINKVYGKTPSLMTGYYKELNKAFEKYANINRASSVNMTGNPDILPANGHDIYNYVARYGLANHQLQAIMKLDGRLDFEKLSKAVRLSVDEEPVFGCRFVESDPPYWKRLNNLDEVRFCSFEKTDNQDAAVQRFLESTLDMDKDPMVKVKLIRSNHCDILCIKVNHACCDGTGTKEYIRLLSDIYSAIVQNNGVFVPQPKKRGRTDQDRLLSGFGIKDLDSAWIPGSDISTPTWSFPWKPASSSNTCIEVCRLCDGQFDRMTGYAREKKATINDLILTAYYRALLAMGTPEYGMPMEIPITVDLRRYLPDNRTEAIRNFSGSLSTRLPMLKDETFCDTLSRLVSVMNEIKSGTPGLQSAIGLERIEKISFYETLAYYQVTTQFIKNSSQCIPYSGDKCIPTLSNLGFISRDLLNFGECVVTDAYIVPPVVRAPGILLMVGTYNGALTLAAGSYEGTVDREAVRSLLEKINDELTEGCRQ